MKSYQLVMTGVVYLVIFSCGPVIANPVTSSESVSTVKYDLMDIDVNSCRKVWSIFEPKNLTDKLLEYPEDDYSSCICTFVFGNGFTMMLVDDTSLLSSGSELERVMKSSAKHIWTATSWLLVKRIQLNDDKIQRIICCL
ncbi:hypothetical protein LSTR_LSTR007094 [Laodelphax striatellus]|uniref:Uncharacterized protein n=1 Tax=Laodelphax striatellus TaxID=195883 RepID=A0A482WFM9_LAOST|nr:hypothetical protein LSTR_LSTR007094 [Laodelphax striatellus]